MNEVNFYSGSTVKATIDDNYIRSGTLERSVGLISESLDIDTFTFYAYSESELHPILLLADSTGKVFQTSDGKYITVQADESADPTHFSVPGQRLMLYFTDDGGTTINLGEFFVEDVEAVGKALYRFRCQTILGIMGKQAFSGGMYTGNRTLGSLVTTLFNIGMTHSSIVYDDWIDNTQEVYGYIPYGNKKDALMSLLFAFGYVLTWDPKNGNWLIKAPNQTGNTISDAQILTNGTLKKLDRASTVELLEHTYFQDENTELEVIFSNMDDASATADTVNWVVLDKPYYDVQTIEDPAVNYFWPLPGGTAGYMGFVGKGVAKARPYIHQTTLLIAETDATSGRTLKVDNQGLVTSLNSKNVLKRLVNLQNAARRADIDYFPDIAGGKALKLTDQIIFTDALGNTNIAHLSNLRLDLSGRVLFKVEAITDFVPGPFGQNVNEYIEFTNIGNHSWEVPDGIEEITVVLGSGGEGGSGGQPGEDGEDGTIGNDEDGTVGYSGKPGNGGAPGTPGTGSKVYSFTLSVTPGDVLYLYTGEGGEGGALDGGEGSLGEASTCTINGTTYSSDSGTIAENGYTNPLSGNHFGGGGEEGYAGANGGSTYTSPNGDYIIAGSVEGYSGGANGSDENYERSSSVYFRGYGGGGGGAAFEEDFDLDGRDAELIYNSSGTTVVGVKGGNGRDGGLGPNPDQATPGRGGAAGHGGGGGGGGGGVQTARSVHASNSEAGAHGQGAYGSRGGQGGDGWAVILY